MRLLHYADLENAVDEPERAGRLAGLIKELRDPGTVVTGGGDNTAPGVLSLATEGRHALEFFERVDPDLDTLGNHDFDHGLDATRKIVRDSPQTWVCCNLELDGERFGREAGVEPWTVLERAGDRLGVFGVATPTTPEITPPAEPLTARDPVETAREAIDDLRSRDVDRIVALSHLGADGEDDLAGLDVDAVLGAHLHEPRIDRVEGTLVVRPGATATGLLELDLDGEPTVTRHDPGEAPVDGGLVEALRERMTAAGLAEVVAHSEEPLRRTLNSLRERESPIGRLVADAYRWATDADVGLQNTGGIRAGPPLDGEVTAADLVGLVPFEETVAVAELAGRELRDVLRERNGDAVEDLQRDQWYGHVSGAEATWDGNDLVSVRVGGEPLDPDATYRLATSDYLLGTPHEFPTLRPAHRVDVTDRPQYEVLLDYAREVRLDPARLAPQRPAND